MNLQREKELEALMEWVSERLRFNDVPRLADVYEHSRREGYSVSKKQIAMKLRLHEAYTMNMPQQREKSRSKKIDPF